MNDPCTWTTVWGLTVGEMVRGGRNLGQLSFSNSNNNKNVIVILAIE